MSFAWFDKYKTTISSPVSQQLFQMGLSNVTKFLQGFHVGSHILTLNQYLHLPSAVLLLQKPTHSLVWGLFPKTFKVLYLAKRIPWAKSPHSFLGLKHTCGAKFWQIGRVPTQNGKPGKLRRLFPVREN